MQDHRSLTTRSLSVLALGFAGLLAAPGCGNGLGLQGLEGQLKIGDSGDVVSSGDDGGSDGNSSGDGGSGDGGSGDGGSGDGGSGDGGSGDGGSGDGGSGDGGSGDGGSGDGGSGDGGSGDGGSGDGGSGDGGSGDGGSGSTDADGDGYPSSSDCDDSDASVYPGAAEVCDGKDNDCDGDVDAADSSLTDGSIGYLDADTDGWGDSTISSTVCSELSGYVYTPGDCDDSRYAVNPDQSEICDDGIDNDCDGGVDDGPTCSRNIVGAFAILYGYSQYFSGSYNCALLWDYTGTEDTSVCPSCDFAFDLSLVYNSSVGFTDGSCSGMTDFTATWAYDSNYYGGTPYFLEYYAGAWNPISSDTSYDASTGYWEWSAGVLDYPYSGSFLTYYYTYYQYSIAYVY